MAKGKKKSASLEVETQTIDAPEAPVSEADPGQRFLGQWNRLVSTTNWEKGRIICQWREALEAGGTPPPGCSDEAWAQLVGGVTSQHVGRLRRTFQRFGDVFDQYEGLYWSHFQAGLDWEDAEMWLEGAIHNSWSVSQMRGKRWETLGKPGEPPAADEAADVDSDLIAQTESVDTAAPAAAPASAKSVVVEAKPRDREKEAGRDDASAGEKVAADDDYPAQPVPKTRKRLSVDVEDLPNDLADAFEQFKLAIIGHRRARWSETTPGAVIECLDALRELTLAATDD